MDICQGFDKEDDVIFGYLVEVPFLAQATPVVQMDLLADVWIRHREMALHVASVLHAAMVYAAFNRVGRVISDKWTLDLSWLTAQPKQVVAADAKRSTIKEQDAPLVGKQARLGKPA